MRSARTVGPRAVEAALVGGTVGEWGLTSARTLKGRLPRPAGRSLRAEGEGTEKTLLRRARGKGRQERTLVLVLAADSGRLGVSTTGVEGVTGFAVPALSLGVATLSLTR